MHATRGTWVYLHPDAQPPYRATRDSHRLHCTEPDALKRYTDADEFASFHGLKWPRASR